MYLGTSGGDASIIACSCFLAGWGGLALIFHKTFLCVKQKSADSQCSCRLVARVASYYY